MLRSIVKDRVQLVLEKAVHQPMRNPALPARLPLRPRLLYSVSGGEKREI